MTGRERRQRGNDWGRAVFCIIWLLAAVAALLAISPPAQANLVQNGSFELTVAGVSSPGAHICANGTTTSVCTSNLQYWSATCSSSGCGGTSTPGSIMFGGTGGSAWNSNMGLAGTVPNSPDGGNFIGIDGDPQYSNSIFQTISGLIVGMTYQLSFYQAAAQQLGLSGATTDQWQVTFGSSSFTSAVMNDQSQSYTPWTVQTALFTATATSQVLTFLAVGSPAGEPPISLLDGVSLTQVPEPASAFIALAAFAGLGALARRQRRHGVSASSCLAGQT